MTIIHQFMYHILYFSPEHPHTLVQTRAQKGKEPNKMLLLLPFLSSLSSLGQTSLSPSVSSKPQLQPI